MKKKNCKTLVSLFSLNYPKQHPCVVPVSFSPSILLQPYCSTDMGTAPNNSRLFYQIRSPCCLIHRNKGALEERSWNHLKLGTVWNKVVYLSPHCFQFSFCLMPSHSRIMETEWLEINLFHASHLKSPRKTGNILVCKVMFANDTAFIAYNYQDAQQIITCLSKSAEHLEWRLTHENQGCLPTSFRISWHQPRLTDLRDWY